MGGHRRTRQAVNPVPGTTLHAQVGGRCSRNRIALRELAVTSLSARRRPNPGRVWQFGTNAIDAPGDLEALGDQSGGVEAGILQA